MLFRSIPSAFQYTLHGIPFYIYYNYTHFFLLSLSIFNIHPATLFHYKTLYFYNIYNNPCCHGPVQQGAIEHFSFTVIYYVYELHSSSIYSLLHLCLYLFLLCNSYILYSFYPFSHFYIRNLYMLLK